MAHARDVHGATHVRGECHGSWRARQWPCRSRRVLAARFHHFSVLLVCRLSLILHLPLFPPWRQMGLGWECPPWRLSLVWEGTCDSHGGQTPCASTRVSRTSLEIWILTTYIGHNGFKWDRLGQLKIPMRRITLGLDASQIARVFEMHVWHFPQRV